MRIRAGTSSWSEKSWVGTFYPEGTPPSGFLSHYATQFKTVEADVTYYRVPDERLVDGWNAKTPDDFVLSAKFPRTVVHAGDGPRPDPERLLIPEVCGDDVRGFLGAMRRLGPKCGPLVLQFPYFNRQAFASADPFIARLDAFLARLPRVFRYAVEIRNKAWIKEPLLDVLRDHEVALVLVDLPYMPHPASLHPGLDLLTSREFTYIRLIGDRKATDEASGKVFDRIVLDHGDRLQRWADFIREHLGHVSEVFAYANNHYAGHGPATIRDLVQRVEK